MRTADNTQFDVVVVGLGPTGAGLAALLAQRGVRVGVVERSTEPVGEPRAVHLDAETMRILHLIGLSEEQLLQMTQTSLGMEYVAPDGRSIFTFEPFDRAPVLGWTQDRMFHQPDLDRALRGLLEQSADVTTILGHRVVDYHDCGERIDVVLDDGRVLSGKWLVGADGASSIVRKLLGVTLEDLGYDRRWVVIDLVLRGDPKLPPLVQQLCDPDRVGTFAPGTRGRCRMEFALRDDESVAELVEHERVWQMLERWITPQHAEIERATVYHFHALIPDPFSQGRVFLAGDAAHQMPPFMGQGACAGLRDAANLAWKLAAVIHDGADESLMETYAAERRPHVREVIALSVLSGKTIDTIAAALGAGAQPELPPVSSEEGWSRLPSLVGGLVPTNAPFPTGHQGPQGRVEVGDRSVLLDELGGYGFVALAKTAVDLSGTPVKMLVVADPGTADLVLAGHFAVVWRPDRYIHATASDAADLRRIADEIAELLSGLG